MVNDIEIPFFSYEEIRNHADDFLRVIWLYGNSHCIEPGFRDIWCGIFHVGWV